MLGLKPEAGRFLKVLYVQKHDFLSDLQPNIMSFTELQFLSFSFILIFLHRKVWGYLGLNFAFLCLYILQ